MGTNQCASQSGMNPYGLSRQIYDAREAKKIEENGGYFHDQKNQEIFQEILMNHKREKEQYESGDKVLVGQNKFINA